MYPVFLRVTSLFLVLGALVVAQILQVLPPPSLFYWLIPASLLCVACIIGFRHNNWWSVFIAILVFVVGLILYQFSSFSDVNDSQAANSADMVRVSLQVPDKYRQGTFSATHDLEVIDGLEVSVYAAGLDQPRMIAFGPDGHLYVSLPRKGQVLVLPDVDRDGVADHHKVFASDLKSPHGLAFNKEGLVVAGTGSLVLLRDQDRDLRADSATLLSDDIPAGGGHWTRSVVVDRSGDYLVSAGSSCNACEEDDPRRAAILKIPSEGGKAEIFARGLRNSVGLALAPGTGDLWASNNGRDMLGDDLPPEEINRIVRGGDYGWPYCYGQRIPDPDLGSVERCAGTIPPVVEMQAHSAPLGVTFGQGLDFPQPLTRMFYVAFHGSWNRSVPTGYKLIGIPFANGKVTGAPQDIVRGWLEGYRAWGRPVAPAVGPDGALYLSDDRAGAVYRIDYQSRKG